MEKEVQCMSVPRQKKLEVAYFAFLDIGFAVPSNKGSADGAGATGAML